MFVSLTFCALVGVTSETNQQVTNIQVTKIGPKTLLFDLDHDGDVTDYRVVHV